MLELALSIVFIGLIALLWGGLLISDFQDKYHLVKEGKTGGFWSAFGWWTGDIIEVVFKLAIGLGFGYFIFRGLESFF